MTVKCSAIFLFFSVRRYTGFTYFLSQLGHHGISGLPNGNDLCKQHKTYDANTWCKTQIYTWRYRNIFSWITNTHIANIVDYMYNATVQNMNNTNRFNTQWNTTKVGRITKWSHGTFSKYLSYEIFRFQNKSDIVTQNNVNASACAKMFCRARTLKPTSGTDQLTGTTRKPSCKCFSTWQNQLRQYFNEINQKQKK